MKTTVEIKKMGINGEGIGYINRKIVFIKGALLNEEVEIDAKQYNNKFITLCLPSTIKT